MTASAFQVNDSAVVTIKDGEELLTSGLFPVEEISQDVMRVNLGSILLDVKVIERNDNPNKVGAIEGQKRVYWSGEVLEDATTKTI